MRIEGDPGKVLEKLKKEKILGGLSLGKFFPELDREILVTITETVTRENIDRWAGALERALR